MFGGADAQLVQDAIIIAALAAGAGGGIALLWRRLRGSLRNETRKGGAKGALEQRVEVLERIATDRSIGLAEEIESLRNSKETA